MPNNLTDAEIKKALECCAKNEDDCTTECPLWLNDESCFSYLIKPILDLINRQEQENESLKAEVERLLQKTQRPQDADPMDFCGVLCDFAEELIAKAKAEAYKEFAEGLLKKELESKYFSHMAYQALKFDTNNLLNELVG